MCVCVCDIRSKLGSSQKNVLEGKNIIATNMSGQMQY